MEKERTYIAIDLKSFYASAECVERGLDPLTTNLVVADVTRTQKTICLAVSPSLKALGVSGRARLFEAEERVREVNASRQLRAPGGEFKGESVHAPELAQNPSLKAAFLVAPPQMARYIAISSQIYQIYLNYIAPEDIMVYSIDEVFMDVTAYLGVYGLEPEALARKMILDVLSQTGITATAGIGTNLYLCKVAMDVLAKHIPADENGVRIAVLDEMSYRRKLWDHRPITDFWRVGRGYARKLEKLGIYTMGDTALFSVTQQGEDILYKTFGINAELLIDHAWGWEPCTMADIKAYEPQTNSLSSGQVLKEPYSCQKARIIVREMTEALALDLAGKHLVTAQLVLTVGYDAVNLRDARQRENYRGEIKADHYGRQVPKHAHGTENLKRHTSSARLLVQAALALYDRIINPQLLIRRITVEAANTIDEKQAEEQEKDVPEQLDLFTDYAARDEARAKEEAALEKEKRLMRASLEIQKRFGKNAIIKGTSLQEGATGMERAGQIGGHKA